MSIGMSPVEMRNCHNVRLVLRSKEIAWPD
jgi:hypothetical protein